MQVLHGSMAVGLVSSAPGQPPDMCHPGPAALGNPRDLPALSWGCLQGQKAPLLESSYPLFSALAHSSLTQPCFPPGWHSAHEDQATQVCPHVTWRPSRSALQPLAWEILSGE